MKNVAKQERKKQNIQSALALVNIVVFFVYLFLNKKVVLIGLFHLFSHNVLEVLWNIVLTYLAIRAFIRLVVIPIWFFIFADHSMIGQKIHWHKSILPELQPEHQDLNKTRFLILLAIAIILKMAAYIPSYFFMKWSLNYSKIVTIPTISVEAMRFFQNTSLQVASFFAVFLVILWFLLIFEGRSRIFARLLIYNRNRKKENDWKKQLPLLDWDYKSKELDVCLFNYFTDFNSKIIYETSSRELPCIMSEKCLKTNTLVIAPTGGGKTSGFVVPLLYQGIKWQYDDEKKKASLAVYDPKAELTDFVVKIATEENREKDLCILNFQSSNTINPIHIDRVWDGQSAWKVSSWIVNAWQSFQGKSSGEPYWETQAYILIRNILVMIYFYKDGNAKIYDVSKALSTAPKGCFNQNNNKRILNEFGEYVLMPYLKTLSIDESVKFLRAIDNFLVDPILIDTKTKLEMNSYLEKERTAIFSQTEELLEKEQVMNQMKGIDENSYLKLKDEYYSRLCELVSKDIAKIDELTLQIELKRHYLIQKSLTFKDQGHEANLVIKDACEWFFNAWSSNNDDNRGSIVSSPLPFLQQFETPELKRIFSPEKPTVVLEDIIKEGKIFVPSFSAIFTGQQLANAIISLVKSRWQHAVLSMPDDKRIKLQIMDEAQRVISFGGGGVTGDFEYMELSRSFGGITFLLSQSLSAIKARASNPAQFEKIHGVVRNIICLGTNDLQTIDFFKNLSGQTIKERVSKTITETGQNPKLEMISEKYQGDTDSLGIAYTVSESQESRILTRDIQEAKAFTAFASLFNGFESTIYFLALKPHFWVDKRDKWIVMNKCAFREDQKEDILRGKNKKV